MISIAVPSLNYGNYLRDALQSILNQTIEMEILLCDGGSTDNSQKIIEEFEGKIHWHEVAADDGQSHAINKALKHATGKYFCWLCADDYFIDDNLKFIVDALEMAPQSHWAYGDCIFLDQKKNKTKLKSTGGFSQKKLAKGCFIHQPSTIVRTQSLRELKGLSQRLHYAMDYDLWWRMYLHFGKPIYINKPIAVNRNHSQTKTNNFRKEQFNEALKTVMRHNGQLPLIWRLKKPYSVHIKTLKKKFDENFTPL